MTKKEIVKTLQEDLKVKKEIIAIKAVKQAPAGIAQYEGQALPGMCALLGEVLKEGFVRYVIKENMGCFESLTATGTCENLSRDKYLEIHDRAESKLSHAQGRSDPYVILRQGGWILRTPAC